jgi:hypothetical protein
VTEDIELTQRESESELDIIRAFGWSIIEFEEVLFQKFLIMSGPNSIMTREQFGKNLARMHSKGYIAPLQFLGKKVWKRLVVADVMEDTLSPRPMKRATIGAESDLFGSGVRQKTEEHLVSESRVIAEDILRTMRGRLFSGKDPDQRAREILKRHASGMRRALSESSQGFLDYVRSNTPEMSEEMQTILSSKGEELLLLSLRLIEAGYPGS